MNKLHLSHSECNKLTKMINELKKEVSSYILQTLIRYTSCMGVGKNLTPLVFKEQINTQNSVLQQSTFCFITLMNVLNILKSTWGIIAVKLMSQFVYKCSLNIMLCIIILLFENNTFISSTLTTFCVYIPIFD